MLSTEQIDSLLFLITIVCSGVYVHSIRKKRVLSNSGKAIAFLVVFLVLYGLLNVCAHIVAVTTVAIIKAKADTFVYDLRFYTLIQFGVLLAIINGYLLRKVNRLCLTNQSSYAEVVKVCSLQMLIALPLIPFNPLSSMPVLTSIFLMVLVRRAIRKNTFALEPAAQEVLQDMPLKQLV